MRKVITGFSNPTVKFVRSLRDKKHRKREQRFLAEGLRLLTDAREGGRVPEILLMAQGRDPHPLLDVLEQTVAAAGGDVLELPEDLLAKVTGKDNPQAVAGVFAEWDTGLATIDRHAAPIWLVAQAMRDPGNLGTMLRTADAVGAGGLILLDDCADPFSVEAVARQHGGYLHPAACPGALGRFHRLAARGRGATRGGVAAGGGALSRCALRCALLRNGRERIARAARGLRNGLRSARDHADEGAGRQFERGGGRGSAGLRGVGVARGVKRRHRR